jgi:hypothetical protein
MELVSGTGRYSLVNWHDAGEFFFGAAAAVDDNQGRLIG